MHDKSQFDDGVMLLDLGAADYTAIMDLWHAAGLRVRPHGRDSRGAFERQIDGGRQRVVGLRAGGRLAGVVVLTHDGRKGWINRLAVHPDYQRRGLASRLIHEAERWFRDELGLEIWSALIEPENQASQALFRANSYEEATLVYVRKRLGPDV